MHPRILQFKDYQCGYYQKKFAQPYHIITTVIEIHKSDFLSQRM